MSKEYGVEGSSSHPKTCNRCTIKGLPISRFSVFSALLAPLGGFVFGYEAGQIDATLSMEDFLNRFGQCDASGSCELTDVRSGLLVGLLSIGTLIGALLGAPTADLFGRRGAMFLGCGFFIVGALIQITSFYAWHQVAIGRLVAGIGAGALSATVPIYQAETAPAQIRGALTGMYELFISLGNLVAYCISIGTREINNSGSWRTVVGIGIPFALFLATTVHLLPESPRWSTLCGNLEAARQTVAKVCALPEDDPVVSNKLEEISDSMKVADRTDKESSGAGKIPDKKGSLTQRGRSTNKRSYFKEWGDCFRGFRAGSSRMGYRTLLGMSLQSLQQLTGRNYFFYFGDTIFESVGVSDWYIIQITLSSIEVVSTLLGLYVMERFGRRQPLIIGALWQSLWLFVFAIAGTVKNPADDEHVAKLMVVSMCLFILGFGATWGPGTWIVIAEIFPTRSRAKQSALSTGSNWLWNFLLAFFTPFIVSSIGLRYVFVFASCNLVGALVVYFFLYESAGMSLEMVDLMYRDASAKPRSSRQWNPPGHSSRAEVDTETQNSEEGSVYSRERR